MEKTIKIPFKIDTQFVNDVMCTALEGGINYWCCEAECTDRKGVEYLSDVIGAGGTITLIDEEENRRYNLDFAQFSRGFQRYVDWCFKNNRPAYTDPSDIDAEIADIIIQFALFGDIVFG